MITIFVAEHPHELERGTTLFALRDAVKRDADVIVHNGAPVDADRILQDGDAVVFIRRGEMPGPDELDALMAARHTPGVHQKLRDACVGIAGLGGLGSAVAVALARIGVGRLILADFDVVEPSNLNRQQYFIEQIGLAKTEALADNIRRINPSVTLETHQIRLSPANIPVLFGHVHALVEAFDRAEEKAMLIETVVTHMPDTPLVAASGLAGHNSANLIRTRKIRRNFYLCGDGMAAARPGQGLMAPRVGVAAHHQANAILQLLLGEEPV